VKRRLLIVLAAVVALLLVAKFVITPYLVVGESMTPTLRHMDLCLMQKVWSYRPARGEIVVFRTADDPALFFVKRVVALPGETISITNGVVQIDNKPLPEPYTPPNPDWEMQATPVPADEVFVIGDNRTVALDETVHGLVATRLVQARLLTHWRWKR
jgi:signal peptidase I